jgi:hypothetical protein
MDLFSSRVDAWICSALSLDDFHFLGFLEHITLLALSEPCEPFYNRLHFTMNFILQALYLREASIHNWEGWEGEKGWILWKEINQKEICAYEISFFGWTLALVDRIARCIMPCSYTGPSFTHSSLPKPLITDISSFAESSHPGSILPNALTTPKKPRDVLIR